MGAKSHLKRITASAFWLAEAHKNSTLAIFELPQAAKCLKLRRGGKLEGVWTHERRILTPRYFSCAL